MTRRPGMVLAVLAAFLLAVLVGGEAARGAAQGGVAAPADGRWTRLAQDGNSRLAIGPRALWCATLGQDTGRIVELGPGRAVDGVAVVEPAAGGPAAGGVGQGWVLAGGVPGESGWVVRLDAALDERARAVFPADCIEAVAVCGTRVVAGGADGVVHVLRRDTLADARVVHRHEGAVRVLLAVGDAVVSGGQDGALRWLDPVSGSVRRRIDDHTAAVGALAMAPAPGAEAAAGGWLYSGSDDGTVRVHDAEGRARRTYHRLGAPVWALAAADRAVPEGEADPEVGVVLADGAVLEGGVVLAGLADGRLLRLHADAARWTALEPLPAPIQALRFLSPAGGAADGAAEADPGLWIAAGELHYRPSPWLR